MTNRFKISESQIMAALKAAEWVPFFEENDPEEHEDYLEEVNAAISDVEYLIETASENKPLACEILGAIRNEKYSWLNQFDSEIVEAAAIALEPRAKIEESLDVVYVFVGQEFFKMTRSAFVNEFNVSQPTYCDFLAANGQIDGVMDFGDKYSAIDYANQLREQGDITAEKLAQILNEIR